MASVLDLPLEEQKRLAKDIYKYNNFEKWQEDTRKRLEENEKERERLKSYKPSRAEVASKIHSLRTNEHAIGFYQRVSGDYNLTAEQVIANLEKLEAID